MDQIIDPGIVRQLSYAQKAEAIRQQINESFPQDETDAFVRQALILYGPKIIMGCTERKFRTPGERFAQLLLESSKIKNGQRVWSSLTEVYNNFGGVKATKDTKHTPALKTEEVLKGKRGTYKLKFAAFDTKWHGLDKYIKVLSKKRYKKAMKLSGREHFTALAVSGYCTEPPSRYADLCMGLFKSHNLSKLNKIQRQWESYSSGSTALAQASLR